MKIWKILLSALFLSVTFVALTQNAVKVTEKKLIIPTYEVLAPDPNPIFFNGRRYQGASGRVYPYPLIDNLSENLVDKEYTALILENEYIEVCVLPELGGKFYYARDKTNDYYFIYYNRVIKPALIGMTGAWTSGGVEWNIPHHHRASTFSPVDYTITEQEDGSKTIWVGETELRHRMKWQAGLTLYPGKAFVEATVRVMNTTPVQHSILVWANAATHTNENYQVIFPPQTQYATFHKKNEFTEWPVSHQVYTGADFTAGVDISWWKNHIKSSSFFAWKPGDNFVAGFDHGKQAGTVIFGDPHRNPGKKLWSWGNNERAELWNRFLTDTDGHYVELMFGAFSDNQPDYSWIHPGETKETKMYFMPGRDIPSVKKANRHGFVDLEVRDGKARLGVYSSAALPEATVILLRNGEVLFSSREAIDPGHPFSTEVSLPNGTEPAQLTFRLLSGGGEVLLQYSPQPKPDDPMPETVKAPLTPDKISTADSLFFAGLVLEQFYEPQLDPLDYYRAALELDPQHLKSNLRLGINYYQKGVYDRAASFLEKVVDRITWNYTTAEDGEAIYYLGLVNVQAGKEEQAYDLLYKASWDFEWFSPAHYQMALIRLRQGDLEKGLFHLDESLSANSRHVDALGAKITVLRLLGQETEAGRVLEQLHRIDPLSLRVAYERQKLRGKDIAESDTKGIAASGVQAVLELVAKFGNEGFYQDAIGLLDYCAHSGDPALSRYPVVYYLAAYYGHLAGHDESLEPLLGKAAELTADYCFPFRDETREALIFAIDHNRTDAIAFLYLGDLYYDNQPEKAVAAWEKAVELDEELPQAHRNLAFAYANVHGNNKAAAERIKEAIGKNPSDPRYYYEQDQYLAAVRTPIDERLEPFENNEAVVLSANISRSNYAVLLVLAGKYEKAIEVMKNHRFRLWEGGSSPYDYWLYAHILLADKAIEAGELDTAGELLRQALSKPENIDVPVSEVERIAAFYQGLVASKRKDDRLAGEKFTIAANASGGDGDIRYYAALAQQALGNSEAADRIFRDLTESGEGLLNRQEDLDFFNPFADPTSKDENKARGYYLQALGCLGQGKAEMAEKLYAKAMSFNPALMGPAFRAGNSE